MFYVSQIGNNFNFFKGVFDEKFDLCVGNRCFGFWS